MRRNSIIPPYSMEKNLKQTENDLHIIKSAFEKNQDLSYEVFKHMPIGICITNEHGYFTDVNDAYCNIYKYNPEELIGKPFVKVVPVEEQAVLTKLHQDFIENRFELQGQWTVKDSQGDTFKIVTNAAYLKGEKDGAARKMTFVVRAKEIEDTLQQLRETINLLEQKISAQDTAMNLAEHDMRNNLGSIVSIASILENSSPTPEQLKWLTMIKDIGHDTIDLLKASKDFAQMENGNYKPDVSRFDLIDVISKELRIFNDKIEKKSLITKFSYNGKEEFSETFKYFIEGDLFYIHRMFKNLIGNAIEASRAGKSLQFCIDDDQDLVITIENDGSIPQEMQAHFFDKYTTHGKISGTGLGTYIAKMIVELHEGTISFKSGKTQRTKLIMNFPKSMHIQS